MADGKGLSYNELLRLCLARALGDALHYVHAARERGGGIEGLAGGIEEAELGAGLRTAETAGGVDREAERGFLLFGGGINCAVAAAAAVLCMGAPLSSVLVPGLAADYARGAFRCLELEEYGEILVECLRQFPESTVVHRITGDGARRGLVAPLWSLDKKRVLNYLNNLLSASGLL